MMGILLFLMVAVGRAAPEGDPRGPRVDAAMAHLEAADAVDDPDAIAAHVAEAAELVAKGRRAGESGADALSEDLKTGIAILVVLHAIDPDLDDLRVGARLADALATLEPGDPLGWSLKGWFLRESGQLGPARKAWRKAIQRIEADDAAPDPEYVDTFVGLAEISPRGARAILEAGLEVVARDRARSDVALAPEFDQAEAALRDHLTWTE